MTCESLASKRILELTSSHRPGFLIQALLTFAMDNFLLWFCPVHCKMFISIPAFLLSLSVANPLITKMSPDSATCTGGETNSQLTPCNKEMDFCSEKILESPRELKKSWYSNYAPDQSAGGSEAWIYFKLGFSLSCYRLSIRVIFNYPLLSI